MSRIVQKYYGVPELAWTFSLAESTIRQKMKRGEFGPRADFLEIGTDIRVPTSGVLFFIDNHLKKTDAAREEADRIRGRTLGEARRRAMAAVGPDV